jgi:predicted RNA-binding protein with PUA-like domain
MMAYWLMKSEPYVYSWERLCREGRAPWDDVRNYQARNNMMAMQKGDEAFFYHSNEGRAIQGVMTIVKTHYPDPADATGKFVLVDVAPKMPLPRPVTLKEIKATPALADMALLRQSRLSVSPVSQAEWNYILKMAARAIAA